MTKKKMEYVPDIINNQEAVKGLGRISIKEKLAEKKAIIEQKDKGSKPVPKKDTEKKNQREM